MLKRVTILTAAAVALCTAAKADGVVSDVGKCKDYYAVSSPNGYAMVEWLSGALLAKGDSLKGDLDSTGTKDVTLPNGNHARIFVDNYGMNQTAATQTMNARCPRTPFVFP